MQVKKNNNDKKKTKNMNACDKQKLSNKAFKADIVD